MSFFPVVPGSGFVATKVVICFGRAIFYFTKSVQPDGGRRLKGFFEPQACRLGDAPQLHAGTNLSLFALYCGNLPDVLFFVFATWPCPFLPFLFDAFDSTKGYPGEGPAEKSWSIISANVGSVPSHDSVFEWDAPFIALQETRLEERNLAKQHARAAAANLDLIPGRPLPRTTDVRGVNRAQAGGVAFIADAGTSRPFSAEEDATGLWNTVLSTARVCAAWVTPTPGVQFLVFSFYGASGASQVKSLHDYNTGILDKILLIAAQFQNCPVAIGGDFQDEPRNYCNLALAIELGYWSDPLESVDEDDNILRPLTFDQRSNWDATTEGKSSIDGILLNATATAACRGASLIYSWAKQHIPIRVSFDWVILEKKGFVIDKPASLNRGGLPSQTGPRDHPHPLTELAEKLWHSEYAERAEAASSSAPHLWQISHQFALHILQSAGAKWNSGKKVRGDLPSFKEDCPKTSRWTKPHSSLLAKIKEMCIRLQRGIKPGLDESRFDSTWQRVRRMLLSLLQIPTLPAWPDLHKLVEYKNHVLNYISSAARREKMAAIRDWKKLMKDAGCGKQPTSKAPIFKYLKKRAMDNSPNVITDLQGEIIYHPVDALAVSAQQWDSVFGAHEVPPNPMAPVNAAWDWIDRHRLRCMLPAINEDHLYEALKRRDSRAAGGIDGWATIELQSLPPCAFRPLALYCAAVENGSRVPIAAATARQVMLPKKGGHAPLAKRLISVLPIFSIMYASARFAHTTAWQSQILPKQLCGGIKKRHVSLVTHRLRLAIDNAHCTSDPIVGVHLDKAKCFDRLLPSTVGAIWLALGIPKNLVTYIIAFYQSYRRVITWKKFAHPSLLSSTCGMAQGCPLSVLALNVQMACWSAMLSQIGIPDHAAFLDDSYMWAKLTRIETLRRAVTITEVWDLLVGQSTNAEKSVAWGSSTSARKAIRDIFPHFQHKLEIPMLGATMLSSERNAFAWQEEKSNKFRTAVKAIGDLPLNTAEKAHFITAKAIPMISYISEVNPIPKRVGAHLRALIAATLWRGRPHWRSTFLLLGLKFKPWQVDPYYARAVRAILGIVKFLRSEPHAFHMWTAVSTHSPKHSLVASFQLACDHCGISFCAPSKVTFFDCIAVNFLQCDIAVIKNLLYRAIRNVAYQSASKGRRKDLTDPVGILDSDLTAKTSQNPDREMCFSAVVGCTLSAKLLYSAGLIPHPKCRFCGSEEESLFHLRECPNLAKRIGHASSREDLGPNFLSHGIVELPAQVIAQQTPWSNFINCCVVPYSESEPVHLWTDASIIGSDHPWTQTYAFACVSADGTILDQGSGCSVTASSVAVETLAIWRAFAGASSPVTVSTDCKVAVDSWKTILAGNTVPHATCCSDIWNRVLLLFHSRKISQDPLHLKWVKGHVGEGLSPELVPQNLLDAFSITSNDIRGNRNAHDAARSAAINARGVMFFPSEATRAEISHHHIWLSRLNTVLSEIAPDENPEEDPQLITDALAPANIPVRQSYPNWPWDFRLEEACWVPADIPDVPPYRIRKTVPTG